MKMSSTEVAKCERTFRVKRAGPYCSVQDYGRPGYLGYGITESGVLDRQAYEQGLALVGAREKLACLEFIGMGPAVALVGGPARICLTGARVDARLDGVNVAHGTTIEMAPGQTLDIGIVRDGHVAYLTVDGGVDVPEVLGSRSTYLRAELGGFEGRLLRDNDVLPIGRSMGSARFFKLPDQGRSAAGSIRVMLSSQSHLFREDERVRFFDTRFKVTHHFDRMGMQLSFDGPPFMPNADKPIVSESIVLGDIQIIGNGQPVVLLADRQPTGGYPRIACVISADIPALSQFVPGSTIGFKLVDHPESVRALRKMYDDLETLPDRLIPLETRENPLSKLWSANLISGAVASSEHLPWENEETKS